MSVCAVMLVKDEADIIGPVLEHLLTQVDYVIVSDNGSTDGTHEIIRRFAGSQLELRDDDEVGYWQSRKTTMMARDAHIARFSWVLPCDADEIWYANGRRLGDFLDGVPPDVQIVRAELYNHLPTTADDPEESNPIERIGWRQRERAPLPKVACRCRRDLTIEPGNHGAHYGRSIVQSSDGLIIRHFSWRSPEQYLRKIRNGERAYAATTLPASVGAHWRGWADAPDEAILEHFHEWFLIDDPAADESLIYDPAPVG